MAVSINGSHNYVNDQLIAEYLTNNEYEGLRFTQSHSQLARKEDLGITAAAILVFPLIRHSKELAPLIKLPQDTWIEGHSRNESTNGISADVVTLAEKVDLMLIRMKPLAKKHVHPKRRNAVLLTTATKRAIQTRYKKVYTPTVSMLDFLLLSLEYMAKTICFKANCGTCKFTKNPFVSAIEGLSVPFSMRSAFTNPSEKINSKTLKMPPYTAKQK